MSRQGLLPNVLGLLILAAAQADATARYLPYNPTRIFYSNATHYAYILQPDTDSDGQAQLLSVDISRTLEASSLSPTILYPKLPFLESSSRTAILPMIDSSGNITVVSGACSSNNGEQIWTFASESDGKAGNGTWTQKSLSSQEDYDQVKYLGNGVAFSATIHPKPSDTNLYMFGGMCPFSNSTEDTWISAANYTNRMTEMAAKVNTTGHLSYTPKTVASLGSPVVEAGFSMTPLTPSYSPDATQQQIFVLTGGHTKEAFINMSQIALFSLPQQSWTFIDVESTALPETKTDLAARTDVVIEPRSGHTAVLSEDGDSIVVFGGWVGDISTPATPQLAVLKLGSAYGGSGDWAWSVPSPGSTNLSAAGIFGHGALMLPGGIMMISGGYSIPTANSSTSNLVRRATSTLNSETLFYNVTSSSWLSTYNPPSSLTSGDPSQKNQKSGALATTGQKAGLSIGLVVGVILIAGLILYYFWFIRRQKRKKENRMSDKEGLFRRSDTFGNPWGVVPNIEDRGGLLSTGGVWDDGHEALSGGYASLPYSYNEQTVPECRREVERTGLMLDAPSPTRGLRKNGPARSQYQYHAAPRYDDGGTGRSTGNIHPIEERVEEEERLSTTAEESLYPPAARRPRPIDTSYHGNRQATDMYHDHPPNPLRSHPVSPDIGPPIGSAVRRSVTNATNFSNTTNGTDQVSGWIREWTASYAAAMHGAPDNSASSSSGYCSPPKTDEARTSSNLSEQSNRSGISAGASSVARTSSTRSALFFGLSGRPSITPQISPTDLYFTNRSSGQADFRSLSGQHLHPARPGAHRTNTSDTHSTAATTWGQIIEQGEALLGGAQPKTNQNESIAPLNYPKRRTPDRSRAQDRKEQLNQSEMEIIANAGPTPPIPPRRHMGWMGSIRRALGTHDRSFSSAPYPNHHRGESLTQPQMQQYYDHVATVRRNSISLNKGSNSMSANRPRRTASDGSEFLRFKRGRRDWEADDNEPEDLRWAPYRDEVPSPDLGDWGEVPEIVVRTSMDTEKPLPPISGPYGINSRTRTVDYGGDAFARGGATHEDNDREDDAEQDDWDVEQAIAKRDVQVLFTLPKARLRVVNADPESASQRSVSGNSVATGHRVVGVSSSSGGAVTANAGASSFPDDAEGGRNAEAARDAHRNNPPCNFGIEIMSLERNRQREEVEEDDQRVVEIVDLRSPKRRGRRRTVTREGDGF